MHCTLTKLWKNQHSEWNNNILHYCTTPHYRMEHPVPSPPLLPLDRSERSFSPMLERDEGEISVTTTFQRKHPQYFLSYPLSSDHNRNGKRSGQKNIGRKTGPHIFHLKNQDCLHLTHSLTKRHHPHKSTTFVTYVISSTTTNRPHLQYIYTPNSTLIYHYTHTFSLSQADDDRKARETDYPTGSTTGRCCARGRSRGRRGRTCSNGGAGYTFHFYQPDPYQTPVYPVPRPHPYYSWTPTPDYRAT